MHQLILHELSVSFFFLLYYVVSEYCINLVILRNLISAAVDILFVFCFTTAVLTLKKEGIIFIA